MRDSKSLIESERFTVSAAARRVGVHAATLVRWCLRGVNGRRLLSYKFGGRRVVLLSDLEAFLAAGAEANATKSATSSSGAEARVAEAEKQLHRRGI